MSRRPRRMARATVGALAPLFALASVCVWVGCAGGPAPIDHFYRISVANPSSTDVAPLAGTIHVDPLRTDNLIGQRHLLYRPREDGSEIRQHNYHRWTDPPGIALQTALVGFLREAGAAETVMESNARTRPQYSVAGRIRQLERVLGSEPAVVVGIDLTLTNAEGALLVHESYSEKRSAADVAASADAIGDAVHSIFERFLDDLRRGADHPKQPPS